MDAVHEAEGGVFLTRAVAVAETWFETGTELLELDRRWSCGVREGGRVPVRRGVCPKKRVRRPERFVKEGNSASVSGDGYIHTFGV